MLITAGVYKSDAADQVQRVFNKHRAFGLSHTEAIAATMKELNLSKASITSYLPYEKGVYFPTETDSSNISVGAERIRRMRKRKKILKELRAEQSEDALWVAVIAFQGYKFRTYSGLVFSYSLKKGRGRGNTESGVVNKQGNTNKLDEAYKKADVYTRSCSSTGGKIARAWRGARFCWRFTTYRKLAVWSTVRRPSETSGA